MTENKLLGDNAYILARDHYDSKEGSSHTVALQMGEVNGYLNTGFPEIETGCGSRKARAAIRSFRSVTEWKRGDPGSWNEVVGTTPSGRIWIGQFDPVPEQVQGHFYEFKEGKRTGRYVSFSLATEPGIDYAKSRAQEEGKNEYWWHSRVAVDYVTKKGNSKYKEWKREVTEKV